MRSNHNTRQPLHIGMLGLKGIPTTSGGIERHVEEIGKRLVMRGHRITVFCRASYSQQRGDYMGMELVQMPSLPTKHLDAITHTTSSALAAIGSDIDIMHYHAIGPSLVSFISRMANMRVVTTVHSLDWQREKWGLLARIPLHFGEWTATHVPHATVAVSRGLARYLEGRYGKSVVYIPNGYAQPQPQAPKLICAMGLRGNDYLLFVGRLTPEKGVHHLLEAHNRWQGAPKIVIVGSEQYSDDYTRRLHEIAGDDVIFAGEIYGELLAELYTNAGMFVLPSDLEGHPIVLLEAMSYGLPILASAIGPNKEALDDVGQLFAPGDVDDLLTRMRELWANEEKRQRLRVLAKRRAQDEYNWDITVGELEDVYYSVIGNSKL